MFEKEFSAEMRVCRTLRAEEVCELFANNASAYVTGHSIRTHADGWTISGEIHEDWYYWVNDFEATHPVLGRVWGNFEDKVFADSKEAFDAFYASHAPQEWDPWDI